MDTIIQERKLDPNKTMHTFCAIVNDPSITEREVSNLLGKLTCEDAKCLLGLLDDRLERLENLRDTVQRTLLKSPAN
jgi:hypothetical protein